MKTEQSSPKKQSFWLQIASAIIFIAILCTMASIGRVLREQEVKGEFPFTKNTYDSK